MTAEVAVQTGPEGVGFAQALKAAAEATMQDQDIHEGSVTVVLADEPGMCELNLQYAGIDAPTDVLSFPNGDVDPESNTVHLGDVILCPPVALQGAARGRHSLLDELSLLTVHGVLHLLAHDHSEPSERERMWEAQNRILRRLGSPARAP